MAKRRIGYPAYQQPSLVTYGTGAIKSLADCDGLDETAFFVSGSPEVRALLAARLHKRGIELDPRQVAVKPAGEPHGDMLRAGARFLATRQFSRVVGVGGGSVMDWCRLSWALSEGVLSLQSRELHLNGAAPRRPEFWLVPTTCATGAEAASVAVYSDEGRKIPVVWRAFLPDHVILDGQFLARVGSTELACFLSDALSHAIEAFVSIVPNHLAKEAAASALGLIVEHWRREPGECRNERLMEAAYLGGVAASNCSVGVVHAFAHTMAAYGLAHGQANAVGLIAGLRTNASAPAVQRLVRRSGCRDLADLIARVQPIVTTAIASGASARTLRLLESASSRAAICRQMAADVCLRSNPTPLDENGLLGFLDRVGETLSPCCAS